MFEIDGSQIEHLSDEDLRTLVARLCEAELHRADLPVSAVAAGGYQDAPDGGIDVRVALPGSAHPIGFIPRRDTGFQVNKSTMPRAAIIHEMHPKAEQERACERQTDERFE